MRFLRRNQYILCFLAVWTFSCVLVLRQFIANQSAHVERREDFVLLHEQRGESKACERLYQKLVQELPDLSERSLVEDLERTAMLVDLKTPDANNLVWKYHISVKNELHQRSQKRLSNAVEEAEK